MKTNLTILCVVALMGVMLTLPASAGNISPNAMSYGALGTGSSTPAFGTMCAGAGLSYCNTGGINGTVDAWTINFGFNVSDSFTSTGGAVTGADFGVWIFPGDKVGAVDWCVSTGPACSGTVNGSGAGAAVSFGPADQCGGGSCDLGTNQYGYEIQSLAFSFGGAINLGAGTYYLTLQNAVETQFGDPVYWDENGGPSFAYESSVGTIPSEAFAINGSTQAGVPEPGTLVLGGSGLLLLAGALRRKLNR